MISHLLQVVYYWLIDVTGIYDQIHETAREPASAFVVAHSLTETSLKAWNEALEMARDEGRRLAEARRAEGVRFSRLPDYHHWLVTFFVDVCMIAWRDHLNEIMPGWYEQWEG